LKNEPWPLKYYELKFNFELIFSYTYVKCFYTTSFNVTHTHTHTHTLVLKKNKLEIIHPYNSQIYSNCKHDYTNVNIYYFVVFILFYVDICSFFYKILVVSWKTK